MCVCVCVCGTSTRAPMCRHCARSLDLHGSACGRTGGPDMCVTHPCICVPAYCRPHLCACACVCPHPCVYVCVCVSPTGSYPQGRTQRRLYGHHLTPLTRSQQTSHTEFSHDRGGHTNGTCAAHWRSQGEAAGRKACRGKAGERVCPSVQVTCTRRPACMCAYVCLGVGPGALRCVNV